MLIYSPCIMDHSCIPRIEWQLAMAANKEQTLTKLSPALLPPAISKIIIIAYDLQLSGQLACKQFHFTNNYIVNTDCLLFNSIFLFLLSFLNIAIFSNSNYFQFQQEIQFVLTTNSCKAFIVNILSGSLLFHFPI